MHFYDFTLDTIRAAAKILREQQATAFSVTTKNHNPKDVVTSVDTMIGDFIVRKIKAAYPEHAIWNEEGVDVAGNEYTWAIDPIDGTANFSRHIPHFGISLGLLKHGTPICGAVMDPSTEELFSFETGRGAFLDDQAIQVSGTTELKQATVLFAGGRREGLASWAGASYTKLLENANKTKNLGSSALDICYVAAGRAEAYIAGTLSTRDIAAAIGILTTAGGTAQTAAGSRLTFSVEPQKAFLANSETTANSLIALLEDHS